MVFVTAQSAGVSVSYATTAMHMCYDHQLDK